MKQSSSHHILNLKAAHLEIGGSSAGTPTRVITPQIQAEVAVPNSSLVSLAIVDKHVADAVRLHVSLNFQAYLLFSRYDHYMNK